MYCNWLVFNDFSSVADKKKCTVLHHTILYHNGEYIPIIQLISWLRYKTKIIIHTEVFLTTKEINIYGKKMGQIPCNRARENPKSNSKTLYENIKS